ncbi:MAG: universal stress protein [Beijerinckiaceae bacterium]|nr:universal stress protein [Beijerinckiaceae bacterium]
MHNHILIATDGSELSIRGVDYGLELARQLQARVTIVTATERWSVLDMAEKARRGSNNPVEDYDRIVKHHVGDLLTKMAEKAAAAKIPCETVHVADTLPAEAIVETAKSRGCDLIVMSSHGRRGIDRLLLGSQTARVLAMTTLPVVVYR